MAYDTLRLTGTLSSGIGGRVVLLCNELPISGAGKDTEEAFQSLLRCLRLYEEANLDAGRSLDAALQRVDRPASTFEYVMPYLREEKVESGRELAPA